MRGQCEATITHFTHQHPLHLTNPHPSRTCLACNQTLETEPLYTCTSPTCTTFTLHLKCTQLPQRITHPCHHHTHPLSLLPNPNRGFSCHACGNRGDGFAYGCKECGVDVHVACAMLPLTVSHGSHVHQLSLVFSLPNIYSGKGFSCDVCGVIEGGKCWLYRCSLCGFDAHLACATSPVVVTGARSTTTTNGNDLLVNQINNQANQIISQAMMGYGGGGSATNGNLFANQINNQANQILSQAMVGYGGGGSTTNGNLLVNQINNQANQILSQAMMGYGGGGDVNNPMMGGGGGMNNQILQAMMGGGGGGGMNNQILQAMMGGGGGGGGGGGDLIQTLLNGSDGGVGGVDLSSVVGLMGGGFGF